VYLSGNLLALLLLFQPLAPGRDMPSATEVSSALERVLAAPEFQPPRKSWLERAREWVHERLNELLSSVLKSVGSALAEPAVAYILLAALTVLLLLILWRILNTFLHQRDPSRLPRSDPPREAAVILDPGPHLVSATRLAGEGKFLDAAHELYLGVLLWLDGSGRARFQEHKTGFEYARELRGSDLFSPYHSFLQAFYPVAFGGRPAHRDAYRRMRSLASEMGVPE